MRSWSQVRFERVRALQGDTEVLWLSPRAVPEIARQPLPIRAGAAKAARIGACIIGGLAVSASLPDTALGPISEARASLDKISLPTLPDIAVSIPVDRSSLAASSVLKDAQDEVEQFLRFGSREVPRPIVNAIVRAAIATKVDPIYLMALADKESAFQPTVKASTSSARGLYQFIDRTWLDVVRRFGSEHGLAAEAAAVYGDKERPIVDDLELRARILELRNDPYLSAVMAAEMLKKDAEEIGLKIGRNLNTTELYLAHFLGLEDATRFLTLHAQAQAQAQAQAAPSTATPPATATIPAAEKTPRAAKAPAADKTPPTPTASEIFPAAARANVAIFYGKAARGGIRGRRGRWARPSLSIPEVYDKIAGMMDARLERFSTVKTYAAALPSN